MTPDSARTMGLGFGSGSDGEDKGVTIRIGDLPTTFH